MLERILLRAGLGVGILAASGAASAAPAEPLVPAMGLSVVLKKNASGLDYEKKEDETLASLREQAKSFIHFRRSRSQAKQKLSWIAQCLSHPGEDVFCDYIVEKKARREAREAKAARLEDPSRIAEALAKADIKALRGAAESPIHRALRSFGSWEKLQPLADKVLNENDCQYASLATALGQKNEEFFPETQYQERAVALYSKAAACEGDATIKAKFRLSLIQIWRGNYKDADPVLAKLIEARPSEFISRALYWRYRCASELGNKLLASALRDRLVKEFPLTYHGLLLGTQGRTNTIERAVDLRQANDPAVVFRSVQAPQLNNTVRAVEILQSMKASDLAQDLLDSIEERLDKAESGFKLYVAVLMNRSGDRIGQFRTLAGAFKDEPATIAKATLELFYPLKRFDVLKHQGAKVDPYLVAALIRQESGFNERARSPAGAMGLMQLTHSTARMMERVSKRELYDVKTNVRLGVKYFSSLLNRYSLDAELALAAYNAGPEKVDEWKRRYTMQDRMLFLDMIPYKETRDYVALIGRNYYWYRTLYTGDGFSSVQETSTKKPVVFTFLNSI